METKTACIKIEEFHFIPRHPSAGTYFMFFFVFIRKMTIITTQRYFMFFLVFIRKMTIITAQRWTLEF